MEEEKNEDNEYEMLVTRSGAYLRQSVDLQNGTGKQRRKSSRKSPYILCKNHYSKGNTWILDCNNCVDCIDFHALQNYLMGNYQHSSKHWHIL